MNTNKPLILLATILAIAFLVSCQTEEGKLPVLSTEQMGTAIAIAQQSLVPAATSQVISTNTDTPLPLATETESPTSTPLPEPLVFDGTGSSVIDISKPDEAMLIHVTGNAEGRYFGVKSFDSNGEQIDQLVNTTDPYDGIRPLDFGDGERSTRLQVEGVGSWHIEIFPLEGARNLTIPGTIEGSGDDVFLLDGTPDLATIQGNVESRYFGVFSYEANDRDVLVNTTDPYTGTVVVSRKVVLIVVQAHGDWSIQITAP